MVKNKESPVYPKLIDYIETAQGKFKLNVDNRNFMAVIPTYRDEEGIQHYKHENYPYAKAYQGINELFFTKKGIIRCFQYLEELSRKVRSNNFHENDPNMALVDVLDEFEEKSGFNKAYTTGEVLTEEGFHKLLREKRPIDDKGLEKDGHGRDSHRIQWYLIGQDLVANPDLYLDEDQFNELDSENTQRMVSEVYASLGTLKPHINAVKYNRYQTEVRMAQLFYGDKAQEKINALPIDYINGEEGICWPEEEMEKFNDFNFKQNLWFQLVDSFAGGLSVPGQLRHFLQEAYPELGNR